MSNGRRRKKSITRWVEDYTVSSTKRKDRPGSSLDHLSKKLSVLIKFSNMRAKSWGTPARIVYTYPVSDLPVDKSGRICEKQKISGSVEAMIRGPDRDPAILAGHKHNIVQVVSTMACITADSGSHIPLIGSCRCAPTIMNIQ